MPVISATRYHDISCGHRVHGHEGKCQHLHGHNYRFTFTVVNSHTSGLDALGRVVDFSVIKFTLCQWLEEIWDHKFLIWDQDPIRFPLSELDPTVVWTTFNPTAENMAAFMVEEVAPNLLKGSGCILTKCIVEETRKCSAEYRLYNNEESF